VLPLLVNKDERKWRTASDHRCLVLLKSNCSGLEAACCTHPSSRVAQLIAVALTRCVNFCGRTHYCRDATATDQMMTGSILSLYVSHFNAKSSLVQYTLSTLVAWCRQFDGCSEIGLTRSNVHSCGVERSFTYRSWEVINQSLNNRSNC